MIGMIRLTAVMLCLGWLAGCIPLASYGAGTVMRDLSVESDFATWRARMPPIPPGLGRLVVYPGGGRSFVYETTGVGRGGEQVFALDRDVCTVLGNSFVFLDRPVGTHEVSAEGVSEPFGYYIGKNRLPVTLAPGALTYVRIGKQVTGTFTRSHYLPVVVPPAAAEAELRSLPVYKDGLTCKPNKAGDRKP